MPAEYKPIKGSLSYKLLIIQGIIIGVFSLLFWMSSRHLENAQLRLEQVLIQSVQPMTQAQRLISLADSISRKESELAVHALGESRINHARDLKEELYRFESTLAQFLLTKNSRVQDKKAEILHWWRAYREEVTKAMEASLHGPPLQPADARTFVGPSPLFVEFETQIRTLSESLESETYADFDNAVRAMDRKHHLFLVLFGAAVLFGIAVTFFLSRSYSRRIALLQKGALDLARGRYDGVFDERDMDEIGELAASFNKMAVEIEQRQKALAESEEKYRMLVEHAPAGIYEFDMERLRFIRINDVMCQYTGYSKEELLALNPMVLLAEESQAELLTLMQRIAAEHLPLTTAEYKVISKDGRPFWVLITSKIFFENSVPKTASAVVHDLTPLKQMQEEKKKLEDQLHQAQKMESLGKLAGGIAHDFNNLLMGISGNASLLRMGLSGFSDADEKLLNIEDYVKRGSELTRQLLGFARGGKYEVKVTDMNALLQKSSEMFGRTRKEILIHHRFAPDLWPVEVDRGQLDQVLLNIFVNASQAMPAGGDLFLESKNVVLDDDVSRAYTLKPGKYIRLSITDTGMGMHESIRSQVFDPFFTTRERGRGTGLGLASAYGIVKNHEGTIHVYSEVGKGSSFSIYLPASEKEIVADLDKTNAILHGFERILLVDDEDMILEVGKSLLSKLGYEVLTAGGWISAVETYERHCHEIDLVILDMIIPGVGGSELFDKFKEIRPDVKVLLSSGYSLDGRATKIMERGCRGFIQKPYNITELSQKVREVLDG